MMTIVKSMLCFKDVSIDSKSPGPPVEEPMRTILSGFEELKRMTQLLGNFA